jgi:hypothetical protein
MRRGPRLFDPNANVLRHAGGLYHSPDGTELYAGRLYLGRRAVQRNAIRVLDPDQ